MFMIWASFFLILSVTQGQEVFFEGQNPPGIEWKKIETPHYKIVFPFEIEEDAQHVANILESTRNAVSYSLNYYSPKVTVILHNNNLDSNAYVAIGPRRSEWYLTPYMAPYLGSTEWAMTLGLHEIRHLVQYDKGLRGTNKAYYALFGEWGLAVGMTLSMPDWFMEGDAVVLETELSQGGRGRLSSFYRYFWHYGHTKQHPSYIQLKLGSYNFITPGPYVYGYLLHSYIRKQFGPKTLEKIFIRGTDESYTPYSFYNALKEMTWLDDNQISDEMIQNLKKESDLFFKEQKIVADQSITANSTDKTQMYSWPVSLQSALYAVKTDYNEIPRIIKLEPSGKESVLAFLKKPSWQRITGDGDWLIFNHFSNDTRWGLKNYSDIMLYNVKENDWKKVTNNGRYFSPAYNDTLKLIATCEYDRQLKSYLVILYPNGSIKERFKLSGLCLDPVIVGKDHFAYINKDGQGHYRINQIKSNDHQTLFEFSNKTVSSLQHYEGHLYFESEYTGISNIFRLKTVPHSKLKQTKLEQITFSQFGSYQPFVSNNTLYYSFFSTHGVQNIASVKLQKAKYSAPKPNEFRYSRPIQNQEQGDQTSKIKKTKFPTNDYDRLEDMFHFHSWQILAPPLGTQISLIGYADSLHHTHNFTFGGFYNLNEKEFGLFGRSVFSSWYPMFSLTAIHQRRTQDFTLLSGGIANEYTTSWNESKASFQIHLTLKDLDWIFNKFFEMSYGPEIISADSRDIYYSYDINNATYLSHKLAISLGSTRSMAPRDLFPKWGFVTQNLYQFGDSINKDHYHSNMVGSYNKIYLPGILDNDGFVILADYEKHRSLFDYRYEVNILHPRGYSYTFYPDMRKLSGNYRTPISYPDKNLSDFLYIKRVSLGFFSDYLLGKSPFIEKEYFSTGAELIFDLFPFKLPGSINIVPRIIYTHNTKQIVQEVALETGFSY